jgi:hypothetical protein
MQELATRQEMTKKLINGAGGVGGGLALLLISGLVGSPVMWIAAGVCAAVGIGMLFSKNQKKAGTVLLGAGVVVAGAGIITAALGATVPWLIPIAGVGLIVLGGISLFRFFRDLKKRR